MRVWGMIKVEDRIQKQTTSTSADFDSSLLMICKHFDLTKPIMIQKHFTEIERFNRTVFYPDDFIESVPFDTLEIQIIESNKKP